MSLPIVKEALYTQEQYIVPKRPILKRRQKPKKKPKLNVRLIIFMTILGCLIANNFTKTFDKLVINQIKNSSIKIPQDFSDIEPANYDVANDEFLGRKIVAPVEFNSKLLKKPNIKGEALRLKSRLENLIAQYPQLEAGIFIYDYQTGKTVGINQDKPFATASTIKLPILLQAFRKSEQGQLSFNQNMRFTKDFLTGGSGHLQLRPLGGLYQLGYLATIMIRDSDNCATNMMLYNVGGSQDFNRAMRNWGFANTHISTWLPDLFGTNVSTPKDMGTMLYNIDNPNFLSLQSTADIVQIMSHVKNRSLIQAGLPDGVHFIHKTGDIGEMLGDVGEVILPNGRRYIITMMVKRPWNAYSAKSFIVEASKITYNSISTNDL
ncbi:MAG: serine hydrolase [bacterium]